MRGLFVMKNKRMLFVTPEVKIILFSQEDIITTSGTETDSDSLGFELPLDTF